MESLKVKENDKVYVSFINLVQIIRDDREINKRLKQMLQMDSYQRRSVLNNWVEQLRRQNASENLLSAFSCLFDDTVAEKVLVLINDHKI